MATPVSGTLAVNANGSNAISATTTGTSQSLSSLHLDSLTGSTLTLTVVLTDSYGNSGVARTVTLTRAGDAVVIPVPPKTAHQSGDGSGGGHQHPDRFPAYQHFRRHFRRHFRHRPSHRCAPVADPNDPGDQAAHGRRLQRAGRAGRWHHQLRVDLAHEQSTGRPQHRLHQPGPG